MERLDYRMQALEKFITSKETAGILPTDAEQTVRLPSIWKVGDLLDNDEEYLNSDEFFAENEFYGPSSTCVYLRQNVSLLVPNTSTSNTFVNSGPVGDNGPVSRTCSPQNEFRTRAVSEKGMNTNSSTSLRSSDSYEMPDHITIKRLLNIFLDTTYIYHPYLDIDNLKHEIDSAMKTGFRRCRKTWVSLLNMIFAISVHSDYMKTAQERNDLSNHYFLRAKSLLHNNGATMEKIWTYLLMVQFKRISQPWACWEILGLAISNAQAMGLHLSYNTKSISSIEKELRARTWYFCVVMDRSLASVLGRPMVISEDIFDVDIPSEIPQTLNFFQSSMYTYFIAIIKLSDIVALILRILYCDNRGKPISCDSTQAITSVLDIEIKLTQWIHSLPLDLRMAIENSKAPSLPAGNMNVSRIIFIAYFQAKMLLYRPFLFRPLQGSLSPQTRQTGNIQDFLHIIERRSFEFCISGSHRIIRDFHNSIDNLGLRWWDTVYVSMDIFLLMALCDLIAKQNGGVILQYDFLENQIHCDMAVEVLSSLVNGVQGIRNLNPNGNGNGNGNGGLIAIHANELVTWMAYTLKTGAGTGAGGIIKSRDFENDIALKWFIYGFSC